MHTYNIVLVMKLAHGDTSMKMKTLPHCKTTTCASSFFPHASLSWNTLKMDPSSFTTLDYFKVVLQVMSWLQTAVIFTHTLFHCIYQT